MEPLQLDEIFSRKNPSLVEKVLGRLGVEPNSTFAEFYRTYAGPFSSPNTGFELADVIDDESVVDLTRQIRENFGVANRYLVISNYLANAVLIYDSETDEIFNVDFEGGLEALVQGTLEPEFQNFHDFLHWYFGGGGHLTRG